MEGLTSDVSEQLKYVNDPLVHNLVSIGLAADFLTKGSEVIATVCADTESELISSSVPMLIVYGEGDCIVNRDGGQKLIEARPNEESGKIVTIPGAKHEPFNDSMRAEFFSALTKFLTEDCFT